jgi:ABC-type phosphate transport system substrate-binding protein
MTRKQQLVGMVAMLAVMLSLAGCGGGGGEDTPANRPPRADAGEDQTVAAGSRVTLDGSKSSDPDGTLAAYQWAQTTGTTVSLANATRASASFVAAPGRPGRDADVPPHRHGRRRRNGQR